MRRSYQLASIDVDGVDIQSELDQIKSTMRQLQEVIEKSRSEQIEFQKIQSLRWAINNIDKVSFHYAQVILLEDEKEAGGKEKKFHVSILHRRDGNVQIITHSSENVLKEILWSFMKGQGYRLINWANGCILDANEDPKKLEYSDEEIDEGMKLYHEKLCDSIHQLTGHRPSVLRNKEDHVVIRW